MEQPWLSELLAAVEVVKEKSAKFYDKSNAKAGSDARKALQAIRIAAKNGRDDIQALKVKRKAEAATTA